MQAYLEGLKALLRRKAFPASFNSADWQSVGPAIRQRSFFSANVESAKVLNRFRNMLLDWQAGATEDVVSPSGIPSRAYKVSGLADFREKSGQLLISEGLAEPSDFKDNSIKNIASMSRLKLIFNTNTQQAQEFAAYEMRVTDPVRINMFPAARFVRSPGAIEPRLRHVEAQGQVRRYDDFIFWLRQNAADIGGFQVPWGPWGFNSFMTTDPVRRAEAEQLGLVRKGEIVEPLDLTPWGISPKTRFNAGVEATVDDVTPEIRKQAIDTITARLGPGALSPDGKLTLETFRRLRSLSTTDPTPATGKTIKPIIRKAIQPATPPRTFDTIKKQIEDQSEKIRPLIEEHEAAMSDFEITKRNVLRVLSKGTDLDYEQARLERQEAATRRDKAEIEYNKSIESIREIVSIPASKRGTIPVKYDPASTELLKNSTNIQNGIKISERYTSKDILPKIVKIYTTKEERAFARSSLDEIFVNTKLTGESTVAHEITHLLEKDPAILKLSKDFLNKRAKAEKPKSLKRMTGLNYKSYEKAYKDDWEKLGGNVYTGKLYPNATEILTMGIERLHGDPYKFYKQDPDFFEFVVKTLQQL